MNEFIVPLAWNRLDSLQEFIDRGLERQGVPTVLRLRTQLVLEEYFYAALAVPGADTAAVRCTFPAPRTVLIQCRSARKDFAINLDDLLSLTSAACTYGLRLLPLSENSVQITLGQK